MNITFLIGNGFDLNLGLATTYSDFVQEYKKTESTSETLRVFKNYIQDNKELWSDAELAFGKFTEEFEAGGAEEFSECQYDFCNKLAEYLQQQEKRVDYSFSEEEIKNSFIRVNNIIDSFPTGEKNTINSVYANKRNENIVFNFIIFNYTNTVDKCLETIKQTPEMFGRHSFKGNNRSHFLGDAIHVHGTVDKEMVFGVNDETQILKSDIFDCEYGEIYKSALIKQEANKSYLEYTDERCAEIINNSNIVYIYGMSIGQTDKLWWERICKWLNLAEDRHLIINVHNAPKRGRIQTEYLIFEQSCKKEFTKFCDLDDNKKINIERRIHVSTDNIFEEMENIAEDTLMKHLNRLAGEVITKAGTGVGA